MHGPQIPLMAGAPEPGGIAAVPLPGRALDVLGNVTRQGDVQAQFALGPRHLEGSGVTKGLILVHTWLSVAPASGHEGSTSLPGGAVANMSRHDLFRASDLARERIGPTYRRCGP